MLSWLLKAIVPPVVLVLVATCGPPNSFNALLVVIALFLATGRRYRWFYILYKTLPRDMKILSRFIRLHWRLNSWEKKQMTVQDVFAQHVDRNPNKVAFYYEDQTWTFKQMQEYSRRVASMFHGLGYKQGDVVALVCGNRPEYIAIWMGLSQIGVVSALVNSNLRRQPLVHSLTTAVQGCRAVITEAGELSAALAEVRDELKNMQFFQLGAGNDLPGSTDMKTALERASPAGVPSLASSVKTGDRLIYIYTSGTTGLPKAAVISHQRFFFMTLGVNFMLSIVPDDVLYTSLPLYHTAGGMIGVGQVLLCGASMALRRKFSVTNFWTDCIKYRCTVAQYIGEICRYLLSAPNRPEDRLHQVKLMFGNGLRPQIWQQFVHRFGIANIGEFYGATEGNSNIVNLDNTVGAVGFVPRYAGPIYPVGLVKVDEDTEEPIRGPDGLCIRCEPGETGVFVGKINTKKAVNAFHGYADKKASEKKILKDVFQKGDSAFNSGDLLVMDEFGYFFFKDRTGDTFRWKGENVATSEIEAVISNVAELNDAVVYGVEVPGAEGRAGMAAIVGDEPTEESLKKLTAGINASLPAYARPLFLRVLKELPMTGTFKLKKRDLQLEGYNPAVIKDFLYFMDLKTGNFVPLTPQIYQDILNKKVRV